MEEALELFKLPRTVGDYEDKPVTIGVGKFGPYVRHNNSFVSIKAEEGDDPMTIELPRAIELIEAKRKADKERIIKTFDENPDVQILNGKYGPYISIGRKNFRIPKDKEPAELTLEECIEISKQPRKTAKRGKKKA